MTSGTILDGRALIGPLYLMGKSRQITRNSIRPERNCHEDPIVIDAGALVKVSRHDKGDPTWLSCLSDYWVRSGWLCFSFASASVL